VRLFGAMKSGDEIVSEILRGPEDAIEKRHRIFGDLPVCPFARAARLKRSIHFEVLPVALEDPLGREGAIMELAVKLVRDPLLETLFVVHPDPSGVNADALAAFVTRLNSRLAAEDVTSDLQAFEAHPASSFTPDMLRAVGMPR
jgi:hypothetical protein